MRRTPCVRKPWRGREERKRTGAESAGEGMEVRVTESTAAAEELPLLFGWRRPPAEVGGGVVETAVAFVGKETVSGVEDQRGL